MKVLVFYINVLVLALLVCMLPLVAHPDLTWHDQQRIGQVLVSTLCLIGLLLYGANKSVRIDRLWLGSGLSVLVLGGISSALSKSPLWAFAECALLVISIGIGAFVYLLAQRFAERFDLVFGGLVRLLLCAMVLQFYVSFVSALMHADLYFHPWILLYGFSNIRHGGQFMTIAVPLLLAAIPRSDRIGLKYPRALDAFLLVSLVCMVFVAGTRGTVAAWLIIALIFLVFGGEAKKSGVRMLWALPPGALLSWCILAIVSAVTGQPADFRFSGAQVLGLSAREVLWEAAWASIVQHPWLGVGPMHFASLGNPVAAHPHQALLQLASEWGLPACAVVVVTTGVWLCRGVSSARKSNDNSQAPLRWALLFSVMASIVQSMVDGVLVMPYPQIWLSLVVGWCAARCLPEPRYNTILELPQWIFLALWAAASGMLLWVVLTNYPQLVGAAELCGGGPRFWCDGRI